ncbi:hypothetical protein GGR53DRAFT_469532 [Hypoxylon sp. FL1150]|nr:hypothetical protein GGR53DRAFT_469532 [Hypoxylon sp. FL1150]
MAFLSPISVLLSLALLSFVGASFGPDGSPSLFVAALVLSFSAYLYKVAPVLAFAFLGLVSAAGVSVLCIAGDGNLPVSWVASYLIVQVFLWWFTSYGWLALWAASCATACYNDGWTAIPWYIASVPLFNHFKCWVSDEWEYRATRSGFIHDEGCMAPIWSWLRNLDWDVGDAGHVAKSISDLLLLLRERSVATAPVVMGKLKDFVDGKPAPPAPLIGYAALLRRCQNIERGKRCRLAQEALRTGRPAEGFVGNNGAVYYERLRAKERAEQAKLDAMEQERLAEEKRAATRRSSPFFGKKLQLGPQPRTWSPHYQRAGSLWARGGYHFLPKAQPVVRKPLPDPSLVFLKPKPLEIPVPAGVQPTAQAAAVYPWMDPCILVSAAPEQRLGQDTALVRAPEQAAELPCESRPAPVPAQQVFQQVAAPSHVPELAVAVKFPEPMIVSCPEVDMLDAPDAAEGETLPGHPAEPRSPERLMQVNQEQAREGLQANETDQPQHGPDPDDSFELMGDDELDALTGVAPHHKPTSEPQQYAPASPPTFGAFTQAIPGLGLNDNSGQVQPMRQGERLPSSPLQGQDDDLESLFAPPSPSPLAGFDDPPVHGEYVAPPASAGREDPVVAVNNERFGNLVASYMADGLSVEEASAMAMDELADY